ncbi:MAG: hypothetical protein H6727_10565 [Myxococcales bacterium]|nr:hypothetical protein [Myxococcales bacterium]
MTTPPYPSDQTSDEMEEIFDEEDLQTGFQTLDHFKKETQETILLLTRALELLASTEDKLHVLDMVTDAEALEELEDFSERFTQQWRRFVQTLPQQ